jgi:hypothetical protein
MGGRAYFAQLDVHEVTTRTGAVNYNLRVDRRSMAPVELEGSGVLVLRVTRTRLQ